MPTTISRPNPHRDFFVFISVTLVLAGLLAVRGVVFNALDLNPFPDETTLLINEANCVSQFHFSNVLGVLGGIFGVFGLGVIFFSKKLRPGFYILTLACVMLGGVLIPHVGVIASILGTIFYIGGVIHPLDKKWRILGTLFIGTTFLAAQYVFPTGWLLTFSTLCFGFARQAIKTLCRCGLLVAR